MDSTETTTAPPFWASPCALVCSMLAVGASVFLFMTFDGFLYALAPYLLLAAFSVAYVCKQRKRERVDA